ncbi:MAG: SLBB domain-containing protein [Clostridiales bacterium]|nr:SLBB domain-containing protein [Clostridiales bacterium]
MKAGIVGAGGAGFPTHVKLNSQADIVIANGAECEPLLESDRHLMLREPQKVIDGLKSAVQAVGASKGILAVKAKHSDIIDLLKPLISREENIELFLLDDFYPAGDEHVLVYEATGRLVPMGGIPLHAGVVVNNVYTLSMISEALQGKSFTHRYITVTGEVSRPCVADLPVGMSISEAIEKVGLGTTVSSFDVIIGGPMMGKIEDNLSKPIAKTTSGIIVIPSGSKLSGFKRIGIPVATRRVKSVCCQCSFCTEMCPRFLLGHRLKPHEIIRTMPSTDISMNLESVYSSALCCECGLCGFYVCTMGLAPNDVNAFLKGVMSKNGVKPDFKGLKALGPNPFREDRKVPTSRLIVRLGLDKYNKHLPFIEGTFTSEKLTIPLKQHMGSPAVPVVKQGDRVESGGLFAVVPENSIGANVHSTVEGTISEANENIIVNSI